MSNRFLSKGFAKNNDDDDLVQRQLSALGDTAEENDIGSGKTEVSGSGKSDEQYCETVLPDSESDKKSVLQSGMVVTGSITSVTSLYVYGTVNGNIVCESDVTIDGNVEGNIKAESIQVLNGQIEGDLESKNSITVLKGAAINGNIIGEAISCDGKIEGNINVKSKASIKENAIIIGDIVCEKISICEDAVCKGNIQTDSTKIQSKADENSKAKAENSENVQIGIVTDFKKYV
jgi:cytoskeletal protein CcmA (bactofilin family)